MQSLIAAMVEEEGGGGAEPDVTAPDEALNYSE